MLLWKTKKFYLQNLNVKDLSDKKKKKKNWKTTKPYFTNKILDSNKMLLK